MSLPIFKIAVGAGTVSGITGVGYLTSSYWLSSTKKEDSRPTVRSLITSSGRTLLTPDSPQWIERWKEYISNTKNPMEVEGYDVKSKEQSQAPREFKDRCLLRLDTKISGIEDKLFKDLSTWCVEMTTISDLITSNGKRVQLNTSTGDDSEWKTSWNDYVARSPNNFWELSDWTSVKSTLTSAPKSFKDKCTEKLSEKAFGVRDTKFENVISWCTKDKPATGH